MIEILTIYRFGEINIEGIHCDQEFRFILQYFANENNITLLCTLSQTH